MGKTDREWSDDEVVAIKDERECLRVVESDIDFIHRGIILITSIPSLVTLGRRRGMPRGRVS